MARRKKGGAADRARVIVALWMGCDFGRDVDGGIRDELSARGLSWNVRFCNSDVGYRNSADWLLSSGCLAGVISCFGMSSAETSAQLVSKGVPAVWISRERVPLGGDMLGGPKSAFVSLDTAGVVREALRHFRERAGFRSFGFVESFDGAPWSLQRGDSLAAEMARQGLPASRYRSNGSGGGKAVPDYDGLSRWLLSLEKPAAVITANDLTGAEVIFACQSAGLAIPRDVAVLGMDDDLAVCHYCEPNLSSVHLDGRAAGRLCVQALSRIMDGGSAPPPESLVYGVSSIARRSSTGAVSTSGALVQKALDFIETNACRGIDTSDVVRHCGVSRTLLMVRFSQLHGVPLMQAIRARRLAEVERLLRYTDRPVDEVAVAAGFGGPGALRRAVQAHVGMVPSAWRESLRR